MGTAEASLMKGFISPSKHGLAIGGVAPEGVYLVAMDTLKMSIDLLGRNFGVRVEIG
jgi:hypothetical protein